MYKMLSYVGIFNVQEVYRVGQVVADPGWVDLDLGCSTIPLGQ